MLNRLFGRSASSATDRDVFLMDGVGRCWLAAVGESYYQPALWAAVGSDPHNTPFDYPVVAVLIADPNNKYDRNAIAVYVHGGGQVGHLSREDAIAYGPHMKELARRSSGKAIACNAVIVGNSGNDGRPMMLGIWLDADEV